MSIVAEAGFGPVAQRLEQWTHNPLVQGSNPCGPTKNSFHCDSVRLSFVAAQNIPALPPMA